MRLNPTVPSAARRLGTVLVVTECVTDADLIKQLLEDDFDEVATSAELDTAHRDFHRLRPSLLLLAFKDLRESEQFYLGLYRCLELASLQPHRTVILCTKESVKQAYRLCRKGLFDDYVLFWPVTYDTTRLLMAAHGAFDEIAVAQDAIPSAAAIAAQAHRDVEIETLLSQQVARGRQHITATSHAVAKAELAHRRGEGIQPHFQEVVRSLQSVAQWATEIQDSVTSKLADAVSFEAATAHVRGHILIVDDDEFQGKLVEQTLANAGYLSSRVASGMEALSRLSRGGVDLVLIDFQMPEMNGLEVAQRVKSEPRLAAVPIVMMTGRSERNIVMSSIQLGVVDFVVKPFERDALLTKLRRVLGTVYCDPTAHTRQHDGQPWLPS